MKIVYSYLFQINTDMVVSSKNKIPWIEYNGEKVADSQFAIEYLKKKFDVDLDKDLSPSQKGQSRAFRKMFEEEIFW